MHNWHTRAKGITYCRWLHAADLQLSYMKVHDASYRAADALGVKKGVLRERSAPYNRKGLGRSPQVNRG